MQVLKVDRSFVVRLDDDTNSATLVRSIIKLARDLELQTVAEGVEDARQVDNLRRLGCHKGQGFYFSRPLPPGDLEGLLRAAVAGGHPAAVAGPL